MNPDYGKKNYESIPIPEKAAEFLAQKTESIRNTLPQTNGTVYK